MSTSGGSNLELVGPGEVVGGGRAVPTNTATAGGAGVSNSSPYIRLSSLAVPLTHHQVLQQQPQQHQQHSQHHSIYQKVVDPTTLQSNKGSFLKSTNNTNPDESSTAAASNTTPVIKDTPTYEIHDNEPYIVTVRNSPARSLVKSVSGSSVPSAPAGLKVFSGVSKAGPRLALYRSNSSLDLLDRDNYLNNQARAFHSHVHQHQLSPQQRLNLNASIAQSQVHVGSGGVGVSTGCFTRRKDFGSHGSIDVLSAQNAAIIHGGGHTTRSGSVGTSTTRPFLSLMNPPSSAALIRNNNQGGIEQVDGGGSGNGIIEESKSLPVPTKVSGVNTRETASPRLRLKFQKLWEHGSSSSGGSSSKDKNNSNSGNEKGMGNSVSSTTSSSSNKTEASIFRKLRGVSSNSRQQASKSLPEVGKYDTSIHSSVGEASDGVTTKVVLRHGTNPMEERYRRRALAHYDCQSISANISYAARLRGLLSKRRNTTTGASAASLGQRSPPESNGGSASSSTINGGLSPSSGGPSLSLAQSSSQSASSSSSGNLLQVPGHQDSDLGDGKSNALVLSCPYFRNEVGGEQERIVSLTKLSRTTSTKPVTGYRKVGIYGKADDVDVMGKGPFVAPSDEATHLPISCRNLALLEWRNGATHWQHGTCPYANNVLASKQNMLEAVDVGATYYREYFNKQDHENWFGLDENLGPLAISIKKERIDNQLYSNVNHHEGKSGIVVSSGSKCLFRVIVRSTELNTIRGSILDESIPGIKPNSNKGGTHAKDVIEFLLPEVALSCLKLGTPGNQTEDLLLKLDEQSLTSRHKVGIMYCKAGQSTEEEMYNNETAGPAFNEFLDLIGSRIRLKGFDKYTGGLDNKDDSTGLHTVYSQYQGCDVVFHVSTLLPFTPNNRQQLMRKRHIGNDIVTIVFQEPGALPFTPKNIRSQFQHVFIIVRAINPCTDSTSYSISVSRSREVPLFGPPIPAGAKFPKNQDFVEFLMAKVINAENATYRSEKFTTMATRTRQEYLKDLVSNFTTSTPIDPRPKFSIMTFGASKKKDFSKPLRFIGDTTLQGALSWAVYLEDSFKGCKIEAFLGISCDTIVIIDASTREAVFAIACSSVLGWNTTNRNCLRLYYHQGECVTIYGKETSSISEGDLQEIVNRLEIVTKGCETNEFVLHRNNKGQLGFHVQQDGVITDIETSGYAASVGLKQGSRLVEVCNVVVATLTQDQMIELLKKTTAVAVLVIPPSSNNTPRRGCDSKHCLYTLEPEGEYENIHLKNGVREDGESSYSKSPHPHYKSNAVNSHRKRYEPRSFSPPRSSNSSGYGTGSSSKSFSSGNGDTHHVSPHHEGDASASTSSGGLSGEDKWYDLNDNLKDSLGNSEPRSTPPPVPARTPATPGVNQLSVHNNNNVTPLRDHNQMEQLPGFRGDLKHSMSMNGASPSVSGLLDRSFLVKRDYFQRSAPHHGSFHTKLSPSRSHDMLHLKNLYGLNQLRPFPGSSVGLDQTMSASSNIIGVSGSRPNYLTPQGRLVREKSSLGVASTPLKNGYGSTVPENTIRAKMTYLTDFPLTHSCSSEQIQSVGMGMHKDEITALKNERLAAIKQAYQEKHKDRDRRFKKELSPSFNGNDRRDSSSPDDDIGSQKPRVVSLNASRLTNGASPKVNLSNEVKLRSSQTNRNSQNRSSTLQEDLIRLISPEYISADDIEEGNNEIPQDITPPPPLMSMSTPHSGVRPVSMGADAPSSELYSMRISAVGSSSPKYITPQRQSWSTDEDRKSLQGTPNPNIDSEVKTNGIRSKSPLKQSYSTNSYNERTSAGGGACAPPPTFRVTPAVSVSHWMKDELKTPSEEDDRGSVSPLVPLENVFNLEARVSQLEAELRKEQQSKHVLAEKVANLQEENRRLQEESHSTQDQFLKFKEWLMHTVEGQDENGEEDC
ncbi:unnamed protein product [Orchesella dallaii]|uniref:Signal-induced proliferation-associated 1-like protein 1 n=1 Tax=Orchesella dallaii TaxID=48710 RepID=A0ABP1Q659_9HEXA